MRFLPASVELCFDIALVFDTIESTCLPFSVLLPLCSNVLKELTATSAVNTISHHKERMPRCKMLSAGSPMMCESVAQGNMHNVCFLEAKLILFVDGGSQDSRLYLISSFYYLKQHLLSHFAQLFQVHWGRRGWPTLHAVFRPPLICKLHSLLREHPRTKRISSLLY